jgi:hypothetical protein
MKIRDVEWFKEELRFPYKESLESLPLKTPIVRKLNTKVRKIPDKIKK